MISSPPSRPMGAAALLCLLVTGAAQAGRPLNVDDANVNDAGAGHVEIWYARQPGGVQVWNTAPAYAPVQGVELSVTVSRDRTAGLTTTSLQGKVQLSTPKPEGCHQAVVLGLAHPTGQRGATPYATGINTCEVGPGAVHLNLGVNRTPGGPTVPAAGVAWEQALGSVTGNVEWLVQRGAKPTAAFGLRTELMKDVQLDGSIGRSGRDNLFSVGMKFQF